MTSQPHSQERIGVLLFNLGGPDTLDDVRPFLFNLFADPDIIRLPWRFMQKPLAWMISTQRYKKSRGYYEKIGGGSPLRRITDEQARALETALKSRGIDARAYVAMRYWKPFTEEALEQILRDEISHLVVLPLYPQFSISTTGSSLNRMNELIKERRYRLPRTSVVCSYEGDEGYISALAASVAEKLAEFPNPDQTHILFSAHSVPVSYIKQGDPYLEQTERTVEMVMQRLGKQRPFTLSFQSKVGPVEWLGPATDATLRRLASEGIGQLLMVPVSFVSEHSETLYEMDLLYGELADEVGIKDYRRVPTMNCRADFIDALARLVERALAPGAASAARINCRYCPAAASGATANQLCACDRASL
ncbi:MAG TPA: ferrochelatase [Blastocatellia bacterium]|nr:ferrochelatase [Blastocatellia bacterium]